MWRSHDVLNTENWNIRNIDKKTLCRLSRCKSLFAVENITSENNPYKSTTAEVITILGSTFIVDDIVWSNDMYKGNWVDIDAE